MSKPYEDGRRRWVISISKRNARRIDSKGFPYWRKCIVGKLFETREAAECYTKINSTLIFAIPGIKLYCIETWKEN